MVAMAPGWIRTALGGIAAPLTIEETIPSLVKVLLEKRQRPGLEYLDYPGPHRAVVMGTERQAG
ncbi:short chain dehydrogenase [Raoultella terrigena]|uniref:Short chain dehydrogenase n=1 Tax=Raoultella terrigena TaxID=577 RepID=A0A4U9CRJ9_RAOTE|nr:short chain dehydrogenase [Raoultella terrigena]